MFTKTRKKAWLVGGAATVTALASLIPLSGVANANTLPPNTPATTALTLSPPSGNSGTTIVTSFPVSPSGCQADNNSGYYWDTFVTPYTNDPSQLVFGANGTPTGPAYTNNLRNTGGTQIRSQAPALTTAFITPPNNVAFSSVSIGQLSGEYWVGIACTRDPLFSSGGGTTREVTRFWATAVTFTPSTGAGPNNFSYIVGLRPAAPTGVTASPQNGQLTVGFNAVTASPSVSTYTVTASTGAATFTATGSASPIVVPGLTNGTTYNVTVTASNAVGTSDPSTAVVTGTPGLAAPTGLAADTSVPLAATLSWVAPVNVPALLPASYTVFLKPSSGSTITFTNVLGTTIGATGLNPESHTFTVQANYAGGATTLSTPYTFQVGSNRLVRQQITVVRPPGALILTQRCGVYGALAAETGVNAFPGYPKSLAAVGPTVPASPYQAGLAPSSTPAPTYTPDPQFPNYPNPSPALYPTYCGIDLGTASLVTSGPLAGYYAADGRLNQVSVLDTRDTDAGWTVTGTQATFVNTVNPSESFQGSFLGWTPAVTSASSTPGYQQVVTAGAAVPPGTGVPANTGLGDGETLASANAGQGLGVAILDARIKLLIPAYAAAGTYNGDLTLSLT